MFANISHATNIQLKSMYWSITSAEVMLNINIYCRNIKMNSSWDKLNYQHFQRTWSLHSTPISKIQIATMKSTLQMKKRPSTFCKQLRWGNSSIHVFMKQVAVIRYQGIMPSKQLVTEQFKNFLDQYQLVVLVMLRSKQPMVFTEWSYHCLIEMMQFSGVFVLTKSQYNFQSIYCKEKLKKISEIIRSYKQIGVDVKHLPKLPKYVGGNADFMIGIKYLRYYPDSNYHQVYLSANHGSKIQTSKEVSLVDHIKFLQE